MDNKKNREPALDVVFGTALIIFGIYWYAQHRKERQRHAF